ncbi:MAG: hypothetical protein E7598_06500 [Ruminococcaceae bacterium]|nr:hypothetical protein [Oscillospiraceae bacterium]
MNIDKNLLSQLANLDDKSLTAAIRMVAMSGGVNIGNEPFSKERLDALRAAMRGATDDDLANAKKLFEGYKKS